MRSIEHRTLHRWAALLFAPLMLLIAATGVMLQGELWLTGRTPPGHPAPADPRQDAPAADALQQDAQTALAEVNRRYPGAGIRRMDARKVGERLVVSFELERADSRKAQVDVVDRRIVPAEPKRRDFHYLLLDIHAGFAAGQVGRIVSLLCGLALLWLTATGASVYLNLFRRRHKAGRKNPFWK